MKRLIKFYLRHRKLCISLMGACAVLFALYAPEIAFAADAADKSTNSLLKDVNDAFSTIIQATSAWLWPVILMCGSLLDNELIFGGAMGERLLGIWVQIRNLVNIIFVLILLAIAVYNVLGLGEEGGGLPLAFKTAIPKFVLALIAVNFSFLAAKVVLDFTNVITGAVFALPTTVITEERVTIRDTAQKNICGSKSDQTPMRPLWCDEDKLNARAEAFFSRLDRTNITLAYALRFGRVVNFKFIRGGLKDIGQLGFNIIFNAVLYVVYAVSFIVLFLVLLLRVVALWIGVVLSPLIALGIVLPNLKELAGEAGGLKEKFVANAIAPIKIGLVLAIGYIMLDGFEADRGIHGSLLAGSSLTSVDPNTLPTDISDLQQLMIAVAVVVIIWTGVFAGAEKTAAQGITNFIKGKMEGLGAFVAKLPAYAQVLPVPGSKTKKTSAADIWATMQRRMTDITTPESEKRFSDLRRTAANGDARGFVGNVKSDASQLGTKEGLDALRDFFGHQKTKDEEVVKKLRQLSPSDHQGIANAIFSGKGAGAVEFRTQFGNAGALFAAISGGTAPAGGAPRGGAPAGTPAAPAQQAVKPPVGAGPAETGSAATAAAGATPGTGTAGGGTPAGTATAGTGGGAAAGAGGATGGAGGTPAGTAGGGGAAATGGAAAAGAGGAGGAGAGAGAAGAAGGAGGGAAATGTGGGGAGTAAGTGGGPAAGTSAGTPATGTP